MLPPAFLRAKFDQAIPYDAYAATGTPEQQRWWAAAHARVRLTAEQRRVLATFTREAPVLVLSGTWCGDCADQCPILDHVARAAPDHVRPRFLDRDRHLDLAERVRICGGLRVPTVIFLDEDFGFVSVLGDRTLSRYRAMAARQLGGACPLPGAEPPADEVAACVADWADEFERVQLLLRLSPRLRERHGD
ncbi:MAG: thiol reductase thioredoxin [Phycisphaerae bacterium]|nr:thiol reductase thioredoxin [Phycisphaerae bacterium]